eukprot:sb/3469697/
MDPKEVDDTGRICDVICQDSFSAANVASESFQRERFKTAKWLEKSSLTHLKRRWKEHGEKMVRMWREDGENMERMWRECVEIVERMWKEGEENVERRWREHGEKMERMRREVGDERRRSGCSLSGIYATVLLHKTLHSMTKALPIQLPWQLCYWQVKERVGYQEALTCGAPNGCASAAKLPKSRLRDILGRSDGILTSNHRVHPTDGNKDSAFPQTKFLRGLF